MAKKVKRAAASRKGGASSEYKAVIDDLVMGNRILYDQGVVDGYGHVSGRDPRNPERFLMSRARAPTAMRRPISRVRSVTETSMMFMMPIPPTNSEINAIAESNAVAAIIT